MKRFSVPAVSGQPAGSINLTLERLGSQIHYQGVMRQSGGVSQTLLSDSISPDSKIGLYAVGASGRNGQNGRNGENGRQGRKGDDATKTTPGKDGGPGGDGQDGTPGTSGGDGTRGGDIIIQAKAEDVDLFELIAEVDVSGGAPGKAGYHGKGGLGGKGGAGGHSYSWQTSKTVIDVTPTPISTSIRVSRSSSAARMIHDSQYGHSTHAHAHRPNFESSCHIHPAQQTLRFSDTPAVRHRVVYETHTSPGGLAGTKGRDGKTPSFFLTDGRKGENGTIKYIIKGESGFHTRPYALSFESSSFPQTIYEPGQIIQGDFCVRNSGSTMHSPSGIRIRLESSPALKQIEEGQIEGRVPPGTTCRTHRPLRFYFPALEWTAGLNPLSEQHAVSFYLYNSAMQRPFNIPKKIGHFTVQYPVKLQPPPTQSYSIGQDEEQTFEAIVHNIGVESLGEQTPNQRKVILDVSPDLSDIPSKQAISLSTLANGLPYSHATTFTFPANAAYGAFSQFQVKLYLQVLNPESRLNTLKLIQHYPVSVQLTPKYRAPSNGFLLVINSQTTTSEIQAWTDTLNNLIQKPNIAIWNSNYYKDFSLNKGLAKDLAKGTIIVLDKKTCDISEKRNSDYLTPSLYMDAFENNISLITVGEKKKFSSFSLENYLPYLHNSADALINALLIQSSLPLAHHAPLDSTGFLGLNTPLKQAQQLQKKLKKIFPAEEYTVKYDYSSKTLIVRRYLENTLSFIDKENSNDFSNGILIPKLLPLLSFKHKLRLFLQTENAYHRQLAEIILKDLLHEQSQRMMAANYQSIWSQVTKNHQRNFTQELKKLNQFINFMQRMDRKDIIVWTPLVLNLIATLQYEVKQHTSFWTRLMAFIFSNKKEQLKVNTLNFCYKACNLLNLETEALALEEKRLALQKKIQACMTEKTFLWGKSRLNPEEKVAAQVLLKVCKRELSKRYLYPYYEVLNTNVQLMQLKKDLDNLSPKKTRDAKRSYTI